MVDNPMSHSSSNSLPTSVGGSNENGVKNSLTFFKHIENNQVEELIKFLESETISKMTINSGLSKALQNYRSNMLEIIESLLNHKADPNAIMTSGNRSDKVTVFMHACLKGDIQLIYTFLAHKPNVNLRDVNNKNALFYAINADKGDNNDIVWTLIKNGIDVNTYEKNEKDSHNLTGHSPLTLATKKNMKNTVRTLLEDGANPDWAVVKDGWNTALHYAVRNSNVEIVKALLQQNAKVRVMNKDNQTPIELSLSLSHTEIYKILVEEHNKIVKKETEIAESLKTEQEKKSATPSNKKQNKRKGKENAEIPDAPIAETLVVEMSDENKNAKLQMKETGQNEDNMACKGRKKKSKKLEILKFLKEKRQNQIKPKNNSETALSGQQEKFNKIRTSESSKLEIPFNFREKIGSSKQFSSYIRIHSTPILHLDFSDQDKESTAILNYQVEEISNQLADRNRKMQNYEEMIRSLSEENLKLKQENSNLVEKHSALNNLHLEYKYKEDTLLDRIKEMQQALENRGSHIKELTHKLDMVQQELKDSITYKKKEELNRYKHPEMYFSHGEILEKKFSTSKYDEMYIIKCLQKDILDFQDHTRNIIQHNKGVLEFLLNSVKASVNECLNDYEIRVYGSHATNLCLPWSDLDMVLVNKKSQNNSNINSLNQLYIHLYEKKWIKTIKFIDTAYIPIIKIVATEEFNNMQMDISLQDSKHYGLRCVELVKSFLKEYEALMPLIFALKHLLKNANLNDPYTGGLSSYGLILMVVSYLQSQLEANKPITIADGNIGRLFLEFLCYYGIIFDHSKYVIYTYPPENLGFVDQDNNSYYGNMQSGHELIIVDPLNKANNVAKSTYQFVNIKMAFMIGFVVSREECECGCHYDKISEEYSIANTHHCILKRIFNSVKRFNAHPTNS